MSGGHLCEAETPTEATAETLSPAAFLFGRSKPLTYKNYSILKNVEKHAII